MLRFIVFEILVLGFGIHLVVFSIRLLIRRREIGGPVLQGFQEARPPRRKWWYGIYRFYELGLKMNTSPPFLVTGAILGLIMGLFLLALGVLGIVTAIRSYY